MAEKIEEQKWIDRDGDWVIVTTYTDGEILIETADHENGGSCMVVLSLEQVNELRRALNMQQTGMLEAG